MSGHFSGGCHFEQHHEQRHEGFSGPSFSPFQAEHQGCFREYQNHFNHCRPQLPEVSININLGGSPGPMQYGGYERHFPGPPMFNTCPPQWGGGYQFGYSYQPGEVYNRAPSPNPQYDENNGNYPIEGQNPNYSNAPVYDGVQAQGGNPNYTTSDRPALPQPSDTPSQPAQPVSPDNSDDGIFQSSYNDYRTNAPIANDGSIVDILTGQPLPSTRDAAPSQAPTANTDQTVAPDVTPTPVAGEGFDQAAMINKIVNDVPLGTSDFAGYISTPSDTAQNAVPTDLTPGLTKDQTKDQTMDQTNTAVAVPAELPVEAPPGATNTAPTPTLDQTNSPAAAPAEQSGSPASPPAEQPAQPDKKDSLSDNGAVPSIYQLPDTGT